MLDIASRDTLKDFTGLQRPYAIKRWLARQKIPFVEAADGWPRVLNAVLIEQMGGPVSVPRVEPELVLE
jgi:hypothetical protein